MFLRKKVYLPALNCLDEIDQVHLATAFITIVKYMYVTLQVLLYEIQTTIIRSSLYIAMLKHNVLFQLLFDTDFLSIGLLRSIGFGDSLI